MKLEVFQYLNAVDKYGSLNRAAEHLYVSQPNLTGVIRSLEEELGYQILIRSQRGVQFTEEGRQVLEAARNILREAEKLHRIGTEGKPFSLCISIGNFDVVLSQLYEEINRIQPPNTIQLTVLNLPVMEALEGLPSGRLDLAYMIVPTSLDSLIRDYAENHALDVTFFSQMPCAVAFRKGHPLTEAGFSPELLWNYPCVDFADQYPDAYGSYQVYINPNRRILVDHHSLRRQIVKNTDAFFIGMYSEDRIDQDLVYIPARGLYMHAVEVRKASDRANVRCNLLRSRIEHALATL